MDGDLNMDRKRTLDTREAAEYLNVSKSWLEHRRCDGTGPRYQKLGALVRYRPEDLDAYSERQARTSVWEDKP
jgi:excisionase family DNA binding protein